MRSSGANVLAITGDGDGVRTPLKGEDVDFALDGLRGDLEAVEIDGCGVAVDLSGAKAIEDLGEGDLDGGRGPR